MVFRSVIYDIRCSLTCGAKVSVELHKSPARGHTEDRVVGSLACEYAAQRRPGGKRPEAGEGTYSLVPVRVLALLNYTLSPDKGECGTLVQHFYSQLAPTPPGASPPQRAAPAALLRLSQLSDITIVQLPLAPSADELETAPPEGKWAHLLHKSQDYSMHSLPASLRQGAFLAVAENARYDRMSADERRTLEYDERALGEFLYVVDGLEESREALKKAEAAREKVEAAREKEREVRERTDAEVERMLEARKTQREAHEQRMAALEKERVALEKEWDEALG